MTTEQRANIEAIAAGLRRGPQDAAAIMAMANELEEYRLAVAEWCAAHGGPPLSNYTRSQEASRALFALAKCNREA